MKLPLASCALFLAACSATPPAHAVYELRTEVYEMPLELARELAGSDAYGARPRPASTREGLHAAAQARPEIESSSRPRIFVREGASAALSNLTESEFVQDYTVDEDGKSHPVKKTIHEGIELEFRPRLVAASLEIGCQFKQSTLQLPVRDFERQLSNGERVKLQLTEVVSQEINTSVTVAEGECIVALLPGPRSGLATLFCVTAAPAGERP